MTRHKASTYTREVLPGRRTRTERPHPEAYTEEEWALVMDMSPGERTAWLEERAANAPRRPRNV